jgi:hypothetical protein
MELMGMELVFSRFGTARKKPGCDAAGLSFVPISIVAGFGEILGQGEGALEPR